MSDCWSELADEAPAFALAIEHRDAGAGSDRAADLAMKPGDRVGYYKVRWRQGSHFLEGPDLWIRSSDLGLTSDMVLDHYYTTLQGGAH